MQLPPPIALPSDPHALGSSVGRLANNSKKAARVAAGIASVMLHEGEVVECLVTGKFNELDAIVALTNQRLLVLNDRQWVPDQLSFAVDAALQIRGEAAGTRATLTIQREDIYAQLTQIADVQLATELAGRIRTRAAGG